MATPTYTLIDSTVLGSSAASVTFSAISATGKGDLVLVYEVKGATTEINLQINFNSDTSSAYNNVYMSSFLGGLSGTVTNSSRIQLQEQASTTAPNMGIIQIMDYAESNKHKSGLIRNNRTDSRTVAYAFRYASTNAITSITLKDQSTNLAAGSTFYLYQIVSE